MPISSSGHLILFPSLIGAPDQGPHIDVAVHLGSLIAVMVYFRTDTRSVVTGAFGLAKGRIRNSDNFLAL